MADSQPRGLWEDPQIPVAACRDRMGGLEQELTRVALTVEHLASAVAQDRENAERRREEILNHVDKSNERSERVLEQLAAQIKSLVDNDLANRTNLAVQRAQWGLTRWVLTATVGMLGVALAFQSGRETPPLASPSQQVAPIK
jgi:thiamine pyrophosphate-dependent acetolactate synthase large subunit-like protein